MSWLTRERVEMILGAVALLLLIVIILRSSPVEGARGLYIVRPTHWTGSPTGITVEFTSFYPTTLLCNLKVDGVVKSGQVDPRSSLVVDVNGTYLPGQYVVLPVEVNCGDVKERGEIRLFISG